MPYGVYDNQKPASEVGFPRLKGHGWITHRFRTFDEAEEYAQDWLGREAFAPPKGTLRVNEPYDYDGYGDVVEIREEL